MEIQIKSYFVKFSKTFLKIKLHFLNLKKISNNILIGMSFGERLLKHTLQNVCGNIQNFEIEDVIDSYSSENGKNTKS